MSLLPEFLTCSNCGMRSSCKTARACAKKRPAPGPTVLTPAQLEAAARELCNMRGQEPESLQTYDSGTMALTCRPAWQNAAREIEAHLQLRNAIAAGLGVVP